MTLLRGHRDPGQPHRQAHAGGRQAGIRGRVTVSNATLHNLFELRRKGVRIGDTVIVRRAGDVIPEIVGRVPSERRTYVPNFRMPRECPVCGSRVQREKGQHRPPLLGRPVLRRAAQAGAAAFRRRRAMDIEGLGDKLVDQLVDGGLIRTLPELYTLGLAKLPRSTAWPRRAACKLVAALEKSTRRWRGFSSRSASASRRGHGQGSGQALRRARQRDGCERRRRCSR